MNAKVLTRYNKVKLLAEKGATEGERQAAMEALKRMEAKHPELAQQLVTDIPAGVYIDTDPTIFARSQSFKVSYSTSSGANVNDTFTWYNVAL